MLRRKPLISIVGAGPGDPELITIKGLKAIQLAEVILYDALSSEKLLEHAKDGAELIYVGKRCGQHSLKQEDINALLLTKSRQFKYIVRLKGGDPFIFGRGHEEYESLAKFNLDIEIIPGISSSTCLPLLQKVPLTRRNISESFWVLTGTTKNHEISQDVYDSSRSNATVVILMGLRKLKEIANIFQKAGKGKTPMMVIVNGSRINEEVHLSTVDQTIQNRSINPTQGPGIIIIGEVVSLHPNFIKQVKKVSYEYS